MTDAQRAGRRLAIHQGSQARDPAHAFANLKLAVVQNTEPGGVVAAIFQAAQPLDENRRRLLLANVSNYATHVLFRIQLVAAGKSSTTSAAPSRAWECRSNSAP